MNTFLFIIILLDLAVIVMLTIPSLGDRWEAFLDKLYSTNVKDVIYDMEKYLDSCIDKIRFIALFKCVPQTDEFGLRKYQESSVVIPKIRLLACQLRDAYATDIIIRNSIKQAQKNSISHINVKEVNNMLQKYKRDQQCLTKVSKHVKKCEFKFFYAVSVARRSDFKESDDFKEYLS